MSLSPLYSNILPLISFLMPILPPTLSSLFSQSLLYQHTSCQSFTHSSSHLSISPPAMSFSSTFAASYPLNPRPLGPPSMCQSSQSPTSYLSISPLSCCLSPVAPPSVCRFLPAVVWWPGSAWMQSSESPASLTRL